MIPYSPQPVFIVDPVTQRGWSGAFACFWASGTTNLATVYADAVGTPLANPVQANANGQLPNVWMDDAAALRVSYHPPLASDPSQPDLGTTIWGMDPINAGGGGLSPVTGAAGASRVITSGDGGAIIRRTHGGVMADTLPAAGTVPNGFNVTLWVDADHTDTVTVAGGGTINGASSFVIAARQRVTFFSDGAALALLRARGSVRMRGGAGEADGEAFLSRKGRRDRGDHLRACGGGRLQRGAGRRFRLRRSGRHRG